MFEIIGAICTFAFLAWLSWDAKGGGFAFFLAILSGIATAYYILDFGFDRRATIGLVTAAGLCVVGIARNWKAEADERNGRSAQQ